MTSGITKHSAPHKHSGKLNDAYYYEHQKREAAYAIRQKVEKVIPPPGHGISGWTTNGFQESKIPECPAGMERIISTEFVFITPASNKFMEVFNVEMKNKYEFEGIDGHRLYFAIESLGAFTTYPSNTTEIDMSLLGRRGGFLCRITGSEKEYRIVNQLNPEHRTILGTIKYKQGSFHVKDSKRVELFTVKKTKLNKRTRKTEYKVMDPKTDALVGYIKPTWMSLRGNRDVEKAQVQMPDKFGIQFDKLMNPTSKTLLLCLAIILYFKQNEPRNYGENRKQFVIGLIFNIVIAIIILAMIGFVVFLALLKKLKLPIQRL